MNEVLYAHEADHRSGFSVTFLNARGVRLTKPFPSPYLAREFERKIRYSRKCQFVSRTGY